MEMVDCIVVGAGVVGLAVARALAQAGRDVVVLEAADAIGTETSSRNSEVIHAGIYYPPGSLKARLCVEGRRQLYDYCEAHGVEHRRCGKLIVATSPAQKAGLEKVAARAQASGVGDLRWLTRDEAVALEPQLQCTDALLSPSTGIVDSHGFMLALQGDAEAGGAMLAFKSPLLAVRVVAGGFELEVGGEQAMQLLARTLVNCAGLQAPHIAALIDGLPASQVPTPYLCKGSYFSLTGRAPFTHLIYPVPDEAGLGVHLTLDLAGQARFGPDTEWVDHIDYRVDPQRCEGFYDVIRRYWPGLRDGALAPAYSGMRPKIVGPEAAAADFVISGPAQHGVGGLVNLFGIESPGLTSSLAIADQVLNELGAV